MNSQGTLAHLLRPRQLLIGLSGWCLGGITFFPIFWMALTALKTEAQAVSSPPLLFFRPDFHFFFYCFVVVLDLHV